MNLWQYLFDDPPYVEYVEKHYFYPDRQNIFFVADFWSINIYDYSGVAYIGGIRYDLTPGSACLIPPNQTRQFHVREPSLQRVVHFKSQIPKENLSAILIKLDNPNHFYAAFEKSLRLFPHNPNRVYSEIWQMLWELKDLTDLKASVGTHISDPVNKVIEEIEANPREPLSVNELARKAGISTNHLIRLFKSRFSTTPSQYISDKKFQRANYLLKYSNIPINSIACEIGMSDLQGFNKFIRKKSGLSPRAFRNKFQQS